MFPCGGLWALRRSARARCPYASALRPAYSVVWLSRIALGVARHLSVTPFSSPYRPEFGTACATFTVTVRKRVPGRRPALAPTRGAAAAAIGQHEVAFVCVASEKRGARSAHPRCSSDFAFHGPLSGKGGVAGSPGVLVEIEHTTTHTLADCQQQPLTRGQQRMSGVRGTWSRGGAATSPCSRGKGGLPTRYRTPPGLSPSARGRHPADSRVYP